MKLMMPTETHNGHLGADFRARTRRSLIKFAAERVVTPFSGFILSDFYLSDEIDSRNLSYLNPRSLRLPGNGGGGGIIYVQVDQIAEFVENYLPLVTGPFVLFTSKWHLPGLAKTRGVEDVLKSPNLVTWYSTNQVFPELGIRPFPYGISHEAAWLVWKRMVAPRFLPRRSRILVPYATQHSHLAKRPREIRQSLAPMMQAQVPLPGYLGAMQTSRYVFSPPGDRPDTYRHWEALAMGAIPVLVFEPFLEELLGRHAVFCENLVDASEALIGASDARPGPFLARLSYWKAGVRRETLEALQARKV